MAAVYLLHNSPLRRAFSTPKPPCAMPEYRQPLQGWIPARVRYDNTITPGARLLFSELAGLAVSEGYCLATNTQLAVKFGVDRRTVQRWLSELRGAGFIRFDWDVHHEAPRRIYLTVFPTAANTNNE